MHQTTTRSTPDGSIKPIRSSVCTTEPTFPGLPAHWAAGRRNSQTRNLSSILGYRQKHAGVEL
jgi:hypothetical protein